MIEVGHKLQWAGKRLLYWLGSYLPVDVFEKFFDTIATFATFRMRTAAIVFKSQDWLRIAITRKSVDMINLLDKYDFDFQASIHKVYSHAKSIYLTMCEKGFVNGMKKLDQILQSKKSNTKVDTTNSFYRSRYPVNRYLNVKLSWLDSSKFDIDDDGNNALHLAASSQNVEMVEYLLNHVYFPQNNLNNTHGVKAINQPNHSNQTPLVFACKYNSYKIMPIFKLFMQYNKNLTDYDVWFAMFSSAYYNNLFVLKYMFDNQLGINTINSSGDDSDYDSTPLMGAIAKHNVEAVEILCKYESIDINTIGNKFQDNFTALQFFSIMDIIKC